MTRAHAATEFAWIAERVRKWQEASHDPRLARTGPDGRPLYRLTSGGNIVRTRWVSKAQRQRVLERDGNRCIWCGAEDGLEVDHIIRYADGGGNGLDNLRTLCHACHATRGDR
jgi:hypothetical protein